MAAALAAVAVGLAPVGAPVQRCVVDDPRLAELSGLAVVGDAVWAMPDGGRRVTLYRLDLAGCAVTDVRTAPVDPFDAEDLAVGPGSALWVADTGDNELRRPTVAVIAVPPDGPARLHRLTYPDGPHDAEALLVGTDGVPVIVTKDVGRAGVYAAEAGLGDSPGPTPLVHAADVVLPGSDTRGGPVGAFGSQVVTGAAAAPGVVALRTYTDAWLFALPGPGTAADVVRALAGRPVRVPLPGEPQGEALAFTGDGTLLSGGETRGGVAGEIRAVPGAASLVAAGSAAAGAPPSVAAGPRAPSPARSAAIGAGVLVVALGVVTALVARRR